MIISILGTAGRDFKTKEPVSFYYGTLFFLK